MRTKKKTLKGVIYVKKNLVLQKLEGSTIAKQFQEIIEYAYRNNIQIIKSYCDVGESGLEMGPDLQNLINEINAYSIKPEIVICTDYNKFGRSFGIYHKVKEALDLKNIQMVSVNKTDRKYFELMNSMHKES